MSFNYSCPHFPPIPLHCPTHPHFPHSIPTLLSLSMGPLYMFLDNPSPSFLHYLPPLSPLVTVSLFFISMSLTHVFILRSCICAQHSQGRYLQLQWVVLHIQESFPPGHLIAVSLYSWFLAIADDTYAYLSCPCHFPSISTYVITEYHIVFQETCITFYQNTLT